jgi:probable HAF family extracellular repeat protein
MQALGDLPGGSFLSIATAISADGNTIAGYGFVPDGSEAFRWQDGLMQGLGDLPGGYFSSAAYSISGDGSTVVGRSNSVNGDEAFRWKGGVMQGLGAIDSGYFYSSAYGASADGSTVVGDGRRSNGEAAFLWKDSIGMMSLQDVLIAAGVNNLTGWSLSSARGVSADGLTIVGTGRNPNGQTEAWLARLDATPTPTAVPETTPITPLLAGLAALGISLGRKQNELI